MTVLGGRLLIADSNADELWEIDPDGADTEGTLLRDLPTTLTAPLAMTVLPSLAVPAFADNTGGTQFWTQNTAITPVTVPEASGTPAPTYAAVGALPAGLAFNTATRVISGTPTDAGAGAIIIRATNSEGSDDWTVAYITTAATTKPATPAAPTMSVNSSSVITATGVAPDDGGAPINSYDWRWKRTDRTTWNDRFDQTNLTQIFSGLLGSTEYEIHFRATNKVGDSEYSLSGVATTLRTPVHFTVNAGDVAVAFAAPQPTVTFTTSPLRAVLTDWDVTGLQLEVRALIRAGGLAQSGGFSLYTSAAQGQPPTGQLLEGDLDYLGADTLSRIMYSSGGDTFRLNDQPDPGDLGAWLTGDGADTSIYLTYAVPGGTTVTVSIPTTNVFSSGGGFANFTTNPAFKAALLAIAAGNDFVFGIARQEPDVHAVDAGDAAFAFALPEPTVTRTLPDDHAVNAGDADFALAVPEPTVTRTLPDDHAVDAGDAPFLFEPSQPAVTHVGLMGTTYSVSPDPLTVLFEVPDPTVTHLAADVHAVDAGNVGFGFDIPEASVTSLAPNIHAVNAGDAGFLFALPRPSVRRLGDYQVDADGVGFLFDIPDIELGAPIVQFRVEVDWAGDGLFAHPGSDITGDLVGNLEFSRGRGSYGSQLYGRSSAGILMCKLRNDSRQYDSLSTQTNIGTLLTSQRRIRVKLDYPGAQETVAWSGYLDSVAPKERRGGMDTVKLQALGVLALLQESNPLVSASKNETIGSIMRRIVDSVVSGLDNSLLASTRQIARWVKTPLHTGLQSMRELEETESGFLYEHRDGRLVLEGRAHRVVSVQTPAITIADDQTGDAVPAKLEPILRAQDIANTVRIPVRTYTVGSSQVLWRTDQAVYIEAQSTVRLIADYPTPSSPSTHVGVDTWNPLVSGVDYQPLPDVTVSQTIEGNQLVMAFENTGLVDQTLLNLQAQGEALLANDPIVIIDQDDDSISDYGPRNYVSPTQWLGGVVDAQSYATAILTTHAKPRRRLRARWRADQSPVLALRVDISDRVRVIERDTSALYHVEFVKQKISRGLVHEVEYILSPPIDFGDPFIFDSSVFDDGAFGF